MSKVVISSILIFIISSCRDSTRPVNNFISTEKDQPIFDPTGYYFTTKKVQDKNFVIDWINFERDDSSQKATIRCSGSGNKWFDVSSEKTFVTEDSTFVIFNDRRTGKFCL